MSSAALTPRVSAIVLCDEIVRSEIEDDVFTLEGVRLDVGAETFPCVRELAVYLLLSYPRGGRFDGEVKVVPAGENKTIRIARFTADFNTSPGAQPQAVDLGNCTFPKAGAYTIEVWFRAGPGDVLKGEATFRA